MTCTAYTGEIVGHYPVNPGVLHCTRHREEQHEEEQCPPVDFPFNIVARPVALDNHYDTGTDQGRD